MLCLSFQIAEGATPDGQTITEYKKIPTETTKGTITADMLKKALKSRPTGRTPETFVATLDFLDNFFALNSTKFQNWNSFVAASKKRENQFQIPFVDKRGTQKQRLALLNGLADNILSKMSVSDQNDFVDSVIGSSNKDPVCPQPPSKRTTATVVSTSVKRQMVLRSNKVGPYRFRPRKHKKSN